MSGTGLLFVSLAYLLGSIPFGYVIGRWQGVDVRQVGSGNIGATNLIRATGRTLGVLTFVLDAAKGALVPAVALAVGQPIRVAVVAGFAAVLGHCFSLYLTLRGGKGVATFVGAFAVVDVAATLAGAAAFAASLLFVRFVALSSMILVVTVLAAVAWRHGPTDPRTVMAALSLVLLGLRHRGNWVRMRRGTEERGLGRSRPQEEREGSS